MSIIIFLIILAALVFVHELGHFLVAKWSGIRVDEFGLGFPPKIASFKKGETVYSLNAIPFGGFVKIFGENSDDESIRGPESARSFVNKNRGVQAAVLAAGVTFNILFAWILISIGFMTGLPSSQGAIDAPLSDARLIITSVVGNSPASAASLKPGDEITSLSAQDGKIMNPSVEATQNFIASHGGKEITIEYERGEEKLVSKVTPKPGLSDKPAIGITMDMVGTVKLAVHKALYEGAKLTVILTREVAVGLYAFIADAFQGEADFTQVAGPVGIVGLVGDARALGFIYVISFTAIISINLAIINLIPFPALDGGRLLFVLIEAIRRKPISPKIANAFNGIGFALLILLMLVVTYKDIVKLL